jgi:8-oxo-dGTP pyrophosphatase MutT (NUDIX family)
MSESQRITPYANPAPGAVAAILLTPDGRYLLQHRDDKPDIWDSGAWGMFGGSIEEGETPVEALGRELFEEIEFTPSRAPRYFTQLAWDYGPWGHGIKLRYFYEVEISEAELTGLVQHEGQAMARFSAAEVLRDPRITAYDAFALRMHIRGISCLPVV